MYETITCLYSQIQICTRTRIHHRTWDKVIMKLRGNDDRIYESVYIIIYTSVLISGKYGLQVWVADVTSDNGGDSKRTHWICHRCYVRVKFEKGKYWSVSTYNQKGYLLCYSVCNALYYVLHYVVFKFYLVVRMIDVIRFFEWGQGICYKKKVDRIESSNITMFMG